MMEHLVYTIDLFLRNELNLYVTLISFTLAIFAVLMMRKVKKIRTKIFLVYSHLIALFFPLILFAISITCADWSLSCELTIIRIAIYSILIAIVLSGFLGFVLIPMMISKQGSEVKGGKLLFAIKKYSKLLGINKSKLYLIDSRPMAFSYKGIWSAIFLSKNLKNILNEKEKEAIIIHEMSHIKRKTSLFKFSSNMLKFSPFSFFKSFDHDLNKEELAADKLVIKIQKTDRYLKSAKKIVFDSF